MGEGGLFFGGGEGVCFVWGGRDVKINDFSSHQMNLMNHFLREKESSAKRSRKNEVGERRSKKRERERRRRKTKADQRKKIKS